MTGARNIDGNLHFERSLTKTKVLIMLIKGKTFLKMPEMYDTIIVGAGVVGLGTAMYAGRLNLKALVLGATSGSELPIGV